MRNYLQIIAIILLAIQVSAQSTERIPVNLLQEDYKIFKGSLIDFHPGLYWYRSEEEFNRIFTEGSSALSNPLTEREFFNELSKVLEKVGCGHTYLSYSESSKQKRLEHLPPLKVKFMNDTAYYNGVFGDQQLAVRDGDQILSIDGMPMDSIMSVCLARMTGDGFIQTGKYNQLDSYFWYLYGHFFKTREVYIIEYLDSSERIQSCTVTAMSKDEIIKAYLEDNDVNENPANLILSIQESTGVLTIKQFFDWKENGKRVKFEKRLQEIFEELQAKSIENLIIDLRDNGGGKVPWVLYAYFVDEPFCFAKNADFTFSKNSDNYQHQRLHPNMKFLKNKWLNTWMPGSNKMSKLDDTRYELTGLYMTKSFSPLTPKFDGEVYILTNGGTFSAASDFAAMMKSKNKATFIGEETGGGYFGNTSMQKSYVTLPNSQLVLEIPLVRHQLNVSENIVPPGRGVIPDHSVRQSITDYVDGVDTQMDFVFSLTKGI